MGDDMVTEVVEKLRANWQKWITGRHKCLLQSETCKKDIDEWEIQMHEILVDRDTSNEVLQNFMDPFV